LLEREKTGRWPQVMKICPFCREQIHNDAIKCRYCASFLSPKSNEKEEPPIGPNDAKILYVSPNKVVILADKGLIWFGKFLVGVISVVIVLGVLLYDTDIRKTLQEVETDKGTIEDAKRAVTDAEATVVSDESDAEQKAKQVDEIAKDANDAMQTAALAKQTADALARDRKNFELFASTIKENTSSSTSIALASSSGRARSNSFTAAEIAQLYDFPSSLNGRGQTIGLIELGGGYRATDSNHYFATLKLAVPTVIAVAVDGAMNAPTGDPNGPDGQVESDIEVAGTVANGARIVVYFAPNTNRGFVDAVTKAIYDNDHKPSVISISWGSPENSWPPQVMTSFAQAFRSAANKGITVCSAAGDNGATDGAQDGQAHVDFPASSPWVLAVGGTSLVASNSGISIQSEVVWNDGAQGGATGGGVSAVFPVPDWQLKVAPAGKHGHTGRAIPDVAADADENTGYEVRVDGDLTVVGGTALATPLWAGLIAILNQGVGPNIGYFNPLLYQTLGPSGIFRSITEGTNRVGQVEGCEAGPGWNSCVGWGSPDGSKLLAALQAHFASRN
jgi:hypothetical protein